MVQPGRSGLVVLAVVLALTVTATGSQAQVDGELTISPTSGAPGTDITVRGTGCFEGAEVGPFLFDEQDQRNLDRETLTADAMGEFTATLTVPDDVPPGRRLVVGANCDDLEYRVKDFMVTAATTRPPPAQPPTPRPVAPAFTG